MNWKRFTIFLSSLLALVAGGTAYVFSCGPQPDPYDYYASFYNPNIPSQSGFEPFYYTALSPFFGSEIPEETLNIGEWNNFFGGKVPEKDILQFVYTFTRPEMSALYTHIEKGTPLQLPDSLKNNALTKYFIRSADKETLGYLMFAKQCEPHVRGPEGWENVNRDSLTMIRLSRNGIQLYKACKNEHIRERFAFQSIRLAHYCNAYTQALQYYDSLKTPAGSTSLIHYKIEGLRAGALRRTGKPAQSAYLFSRIFENAPSQREMAYRNVHYTDAPEEAVMQLCKNNHEKATVAAIYALHTTEINLDGLRKVYSLDPQSPMLDVLLSREMNKLEENYLTAMIEKDANRQESRYPAENPGDRAMALSVQQLLDELANGGKVKEPALWQISSAYLSNALKDYAGARSRLAAASVAGLRPALKDQAEVVKLLVTINEQPVIDAAFENKLLESLQWLDTKVNGTINDPYNLSAKEVDAYYFKRMYRNLLDLVVSTRYARQNDLARKALILAKRDKVLPYAYNYYSVSALGYMEDTLQTQHLLALYNGGLSKKKTPFEKYLYEQLQMSDKEIGEMVAVNYVRTHQFREAVEWFKRSTSSRYATLAFTPQLTDYGYDEADSTKTDRISQQQFAERMLELEKQMKKKPDAKTYFEYATGLFSISYYGHAYQFSASYRPSTDWYSPEDEKTPFLKQYFGCYRAEEYYKKAADAATDKEFKAECLFMAARCAQKHMPREGDLEWYGHAVLNPYFPELYKNYQQTEFYRERMRECSYLRDFHHSQPKL
ncbi:hypothetical protein ACFOTA_22360 [Chitinophaga sp. GCM10012297]|uniref:Tetratricopeptide repeat protein n=1 Tax=Chitinophaga chungangae TaxID=2821488 RepID=A0ABS3YJY7_9BACT|nr:hypothetical protein [Chitinophaga chungangae]MBO9154976.1 hypothetical protein [Chitinophaga chungangae]